MIVNDHEIPYCTKIDDVKIGIGTILYFNNIKYNIIILTMALIVFSLFALIVNRRSCGYSALADCGIDGISLSSTILKSEDYSYELTISSCLAISTVFFWGIIELYKFHV
jgi:hypothetical protein